MRSDLLSLRPLHITKPLLTIFFNKLKFLNMKKMRFLVTVLTVILIFGACSKEDELRNHDHFITLKKAIEIAKENVDNTITEKKRTSLRSDDFTPLNTISLVDDSETPVLYIINYRINNNDYFNIISADNRTLPIVGYGSESFVLEEISMETRYWLDGQKRLVDYVRKNSISKEEFVNEIAKVKDDDIVGPTTDNPCDSPFGFGGWLSEGPLLNHTWGQGCVYNAQCPDLNCNVGLCDAEEAWVGCVATAMAQVMGHHSHPSTYNWGNIQARYLWNDFNDPGANEIATIMSDAGISVNMDYGCDGSGVPLNVFPTIVPDAFEDEFGYSNGGQYYSNSWPNFGWNEWASIRGNIRDNKPVILSGCGELGCHAWVCDGYRQEWGCEDGKPWSTLFLHMNWGWNGVSNGWFVGYGFFPNENGRILNIEP